MKILKQLLIILCSILFAKQLAAQDISYLKFVDSVREATYPRSNYFNRKSKIAGKSFSFQYYKATKAIRAVVASGNSPKILILFIYYNDKIIMISPVGQEPYYIKDKKFYFSKEPNCESTTIEKLIDDAYIYLGYGYKRIGRDFVRL